MVTIHPEARIMRSLVARPTTAMPVAPVDEDEDSVRDTGSERSYVSSNDEVDSIGE